MAVCNPAFQGQAFQPSRDQAFQVGFQAQSLKADIAFQQGAWQENPYLGGAGAIASAESFGLADAIRVISPVGIASITVFGTPRGIFILAPIGATSTNVFGTADMIRVLRNVGAITSAQALGTPGALRVIQNVGAIVSAQAFGQSAKLARILGAVGIASANAFGTPDVLRIVRVTGITTGETFGMTAIALPGLATPAAFGQASLSDRAIYELAIVDGETYVVSITDIPLAEILLDDALGG